MLTPPALRLAAKHVICAPLGLQKHFTDARYVAARQRAYFENAFTINAPRPINYDCIVTNLEILTSAWNNANSKDLDPTSTRNCIDTPNGQYAWTKTSQGSVNISACRRVGVGDCAATSGSSFSGRGKQKHNRCSAYSAFEWHRSNHFLNPHPSRPFTAAPNSFRRPTESRAFPETFCRPPNRLCRGTNPRQHSMTDQLQV